MISLKFSVNVNEFQRAEQGAPTLQTTDRRNGDSI